MNLLKAVTGAACASVALISGGASAATASNSMTNIVTVSDACDIVAIGLDFGVQPGNALENKTAAAAMANVKATERADHPMGGNDGGGASAAGDNPDTSASTNDDTLNLAITGVTAIDDVIATAVTTAVGALGGVYVSCSKTPDGIVIAGDTTTADLGALANAGTADMASVMGIAVDGTTDSTAAAAIDYSVTFSAVLVDVTLPALFDGVVSVPFIGLYSAAGTITETDTQPPGHYGDIVIATVTF